MTNYESDIVNLIPGSTLKEKHTTLVNLLTKRHNYAALVAKLEKLEALVKTQLKRQYPFDGQIDENKFFLEWNSILKS